jgi:hypothetical protein
MNIPMKKQDNTKKATLCQTESAMGQALAGWRVCEFMAVDHRVSLQNTGV